MRLWTTRVFLTVFSLYLAVCASVVCVMWAAQVSWSTEDPHLCVHVYAENPLLKGYVMGWVDFMDLVPQDDDGKEVVAPEVWC